MEVPTEPKLVLWNTAPRTVLGPTQTPIQ